MESGALEERGLRREMRQRSRLSQGVEMAQTGLGCTDWESEISTLGCGAHEDHQSVTSMPEAGLGESGGGQVTTLSLSASSKQDTRGQGEAVALLQ